MRLLVQLFAIIAFLFTILFLDSLIDYQTYFNLQSDQLKCSTPNKQDFLAWMNFHEKKYESFHEFERRFKIYIDNFLNVKKLNEMHKGNTEFALNHFADLTTDEFREKILLRNNLNKPVFKIPVHKEKTVNKDIQPEDLPDSFDWRTLGAVTPVRNQGQVGSCWAFSAAQNLEGLYAIKTKKLINLSVEQIVDCDGTLSNETDSNCGVYGGWPYLAFEYVKNAGGIESESDYSYCAGTGKCLPCSPPGYNKTQCGPPVPYCHLDDSCQAKLEPAKFIPDLKVKDWFKTSRNETEIAYHLMNSGPLSIALNAELLQFYFGGIFDPFDRICNRDNLNHAVLLVGWGTQKSFIHGQRQFWIVKNSWGTGWGEKGYFRIIRGKDKCGITEQVTTAILE